MRTVIGKLLGASAMAVLLAGCGGSQLPASQAKTRFAVAQFIEAEVGSIDGESRGGQALGTVCITKSSTSWFCESSYTPANGRGDVRQRHRREHGRHI